MAWAQFCVAVTALVISTTAVATVHAETFLGFELLQLDGARVKWGAEASATPVVTYSLVDARQTFADARNCEVLDPV